MYAKVPPPPASLLYDDLAADKDTSRVSNKKQELLGLDRGGDWWPSNDKTRTRFTAVLRHLHGKGPEEGRGKAEGGVLM